MIVDLKVSAASQTIITAGCPKSFNTDCGIMARL